MAFSPVLPNQKLLSIFILVFLAISCCCFSGYADENPTERFAKSLLCFNNRFIYTSCEEEYRLSESGNINVPFEVTDLFCNGPCLVETQYVLKCVEEAFSSFIFLNKATVRDIRNVLNRGCSYTNQRGNFNVWRYIQGDTSLQFNGQKGLNFNGYYSSLATLTGTCFLIL